MSYLGWVGKQVRHVDGRTGTIRREIGRDFCELRIWCDDGTVDIVTLNAYGEDYGASGWRWWCPEFDMGAAWLPLGDNGGPLEYDPKKEASQ